MLFKLKKLPENKKIVMAFGSFDNFNAGHEHYLRQAKELGDFLIVVIARDNTIRSTKGFSPEMNEKNRQKLIQKTGLADLVILGNFEDKHQVILDYQPHVIALGYNQFIFTQKLEQTIIKNKLNCEIQRLLPYFPQVYKSSIFKKTLATETISAAATKP